MQLIHHLQDRGGWDSAYHKDSGGGGWEGEEGDEVHDTLREKVTRERHPRRTKEQEKTTVPAATIFATKNTKWTHNTQSKERRDW